MTKRLFSILLALCMILSTLPCGALAISSGFSDMPAESHWSYDALSKAVSNGLLHGSGNQLRPQSPLTRAELAAVLNRAFGAQDASDISGYTDVSPNAWYHQDIAKAVRMGTFQGAGSLMRPDDPVTRQEAFTVLARAFKLESGDAAALNVFSDSRQVSAWAVPAVSAMVKAGYIHGSSGSLNPVASISRAEFAQVMANMADTYLSAAGTYTSVISGNAVVNAPGVTLSGITVKGDLIVGEGVANGDITLDHVTIGGRLVVRGGGENSIHIINSSDVGSIVVGKTGDGKLRVKAEEGCRVTMVYIEDGSDDIILEGVYNAVTVSDDTPVVLRDVSVTTLKVSAGAAAVTVSGSSTVTVTKITEEARGATLTVSDKAKIALVESAAPQAVIQGGGTVTEAKISGSGTAVNTKGTSVTVAEGTSGVTENGTAVPPGTGTGSVSSGSSGSGDSGRAVAHNAAEFIAAVNSSTSDSITVAGEITVDSDLDIYKPVTVQSGAALGIGSATINLYSTLTNNGIVATVSAPQDGVEGWLRIYPTDLPSGGGGKVINNGSFINNGHLELNGSTSVTGGTFENAGTVHYVDLLGLNEQDPLFAATYQAVRISGLTGKSENIAAAFGAAALQSALAASISGSGSPYYTNVLAIGDAITFTASENISIRATQSLEIRDGITLMISSGLTLSVLEGGEMHVGGTLSVAGTATNAGLCIIESTGTVTGTIADQGGGRHYTAYVVNNEAEWAAAAADPHCFYTEIARDLALSADTVVSFNIIIPKGVTMTVAAGATLTLANRGGTVDDVIKDVHIDLSGTLINHHKISISPRTGINVSGGTLNNTAGIIELRGWLNTDISTVGGTVNCYANLTDFARSLWKRLGGILEQSVDESTDYTTYAAALANLDPSDGEGKYSLTWLLKNGIITLAAGSDPYAFADSDVIKSLLETFADRAGKPEYTASIPVGGVLTSDSSDNKSSFDKLIDSFVMALNVGLKSVNSEADLRKYQAYPFIEEIQITSDIALTDNFTAVKHIVIAEGKKLTVAAGKNLTVGREEDLYGALIVNGTLEIPEGSTVLNRGEMALSGSIVNDGSLTNMAEEGSCGNLLGTGGTLTNHGTFVNNGNMHLSGTALTNSGIRFTNNASLLIFGGTISSTSPFHNAGYMKVTDSYYDDLPEASANVITLFHFNGSLTDNSNWIEYTAAVYSADGFAAAKTAQTAKIAALGTDPAETGLEVYNRMDILENITLSGSNTIENWDIWVETNESTPYTLTIDHGAELSMPNCTLHINGAVINNGTLAGNVQVWPIGSLENNGNAANAYVNRMDEYALNGSADLIGSGRVTGSGIIGERIDIAIVHGWEALRHAAGCADYERIDILGDDCDIRLESDLTISANVYIEWDDGIEVPEGKTLTLTGRHWLNNSGDIWVYGTLEIGDGIQFSNDQYLQIDGTVQNNGMIRNNGNIVLMQDSTLSGSGTVVCKAGNAITNNGGTVTCPWYVLVNDLAGLKAALSGSMPALVSGDITLDGDLTLTANVCAGSNGQWNGSLRTGAYVLTVPSGVVLDISKGELEIQADGSVINNGELRFEPGSGLRIRKGGTLSSSTDVYVYGWADLYDWQGQHSYLGDNVYLYADECNLACSLYLCLYTVNKETGAPTGLKDGVTGLAAVDTFDEASEVDALFAGEEKWEELGSDSFSRYAYAALKANGILSSIDPYGKLAYQHAKTLMAAVAEKLNINVDTYLNSITGTGFIRINDFAAEKQADAWVIITPSAFDKLCADFSDALTQP